MIQRVQAMVPLLFFFIRFWGSIRAILYFAEENHDSNHDGEDGWLKYMQAFFDPTQGFFNALLFVVTSTDGRRDIVLASTQLMRFCKLFFEAIFPFLRRGKARSDSNMDSSEMITGSDGFLHSQKKNVGAGLREGLNTSGVESSYITESQSHGTYTRNEMSEVRIDSSFSAVSDGGHRTTSTDMIGNEMDFLTVPDNVTVYVLVRNSLARGDNGV